MLVLLVFPARLKGAVCRMSVGMWFDDVNWTWKLEEAAHCKKMSIWTSRFYKYFTKSPIFSVLRDVLSWLTAFSWNASLWRLFLLHALPCRGCIDYKLHQKPVSVFPSSCVMPGGDHALGCVWISRTLLDPLAFLWTFTTSSDSQFFKAGFHNCCVLSCLWPLTSLTSPTASPTRLAEVCTLLCSQYYLIYSTNQNN